jgi:hypothetical protein
VLDDLDYDDIEPPTIGLMRAGASPGETCRAT